MNVRMRFENLYFELTEAFNAEGRIAILASGQAVVYYRLAIMSKDGDWILKESDEACRRVLDVLAARGARYRLGAPLDPRWLAGGWSSHFELADARGRRIRCDFFSRPPRVPTAELEALFSTGETQPVLAVVGVEALIRMKQTQRAKDYPTIGELARLLPPEREIELTTDPDRIMDLASEHGQGSRRPCVQAALSEGTRRAVVLALAEEVDDLQERDRARLQRYDRAAAPYLQAVRSLGREALGLLGSHPRLCALAERLLPTHVAPPEGRDEDAQ